MAHIDISRRHHLGLEGARHAAEEVVEELAERMPLRTHWEGDTLVAKGTGFHGHFHAEPEAVRVTVKLGLAFRAFRRTIHAEIEEYLDRYTADVG